jgi:hypothetical protein
VRNEQACQIQRSHYSEAVLSPCKRYASIWAFLQMKPQFSKCVLSSWGIGFFRKVWGTACEKIGRAAMFFHDFRRNAVRNMVRSGIQVKVAMKISGHKTKAIVESVQDRQ